MTLNVFNCFRAYILDGAFQNLRAATMMKGACLRQRVLVLLHIHVAPPVTPTIDSHVCALFLCFCTDTPYKLEVDYRTLPTSVTLGNHR